MPRHTKIQCIIRYALFHSRAMNTQFFVLYAFPIRRSFIAFIFLFNFGRFYFFFFSVRFSACYSLLNRFVSLVASHLTLSLSLSLAVSDSMMIKFCLCFSAFFLLLQFCFILIILMLIWPFDLCAACVMPFGIVRQISTMITSPLA